MKVQTIGIIGLQRIGASIGLAIKDKLPELVVIGYDRDRDVLNQARESGAVDKTNFSLVNVAAEGDIVILAIPFEEVKEAIQAIGGHLQPHAVLLDMGPLKRPVQKWVDDHLNNGHYVSLAPIMQVDQMDDLRTGPEAATADLFDGSVICLMPSPRVDEGAVQTAVQFGRLLGAEPFYVDIEEFDIYAQALQTLPNLLGAAFFRALTSATGWKDMRRMAGQRFALATQTLTGDAEIARLVFEDKTAVLHWLDTTVEYLLEMRRWIQEGDRETLGALLAELQGQREVWLSERRDNNWQEGPTTKFEQPGIMEQLFGSFGARRLRRDDKD